jgi:hypothetical protein
MHLVASVSEHMACFKADMKLAALILEKMESVEAFVANKLLWIIRVSSIV